MKSWDVRSIDLRPHSPEILSSSGDARAVVLEIPAGESLEDHQVHERAWVTVIDGEVQVTTVGEETVAGGSGLMIEFAPGERHAVLAHRTARLLLLLTPDGQAARGRAPRDPVTTAGAKSSGSGHVVAPRRPFGQIGKAPRDGHRSV